VLPWLLARNGGIRTSAFATQLQALAAARSAAARGDAAAAAEALQRLAGQAGRVTRDAFVDQRLYAYTSGDWSAQYGHRARPLPVAIYDVYQQLRGGQDAPSAEGALAALEAEARANLNDALFLVAGKMDQAARALNETPLP
jgi:hypothetical protein